MLVKTGEIEFLDEAGNRWHAESFVDENGVVTTQSMMIEEVVNDNIN